MRTEIKIGVAAAVFIAVVAFVHFALLSGPGDQKASKPESSQPTADKSSPAPGEPAGGKPSEHLVAVHELPRAAPQDAGVAQPAGQTVSRLDAARLADGPADAQAKAPDRTDPAGRALTAAPATDKGGTYIVKEEDTDGFWGIAGRLYGDPTLYLKLAEANPGVDSQALKVGQVIVYPPKPAAKSKAAAGASVVPTGGDDKYVVQEGDDGFWAVSVKKDGKGIYWPEIERANPGVDSTRLRPGQALLVPKLTEEMKKKYGS